MVALELPSPVPLTPEEVVALRRRLWTRFESPSYKPPMLPATAAEVLSLASRTNVEIGDLVELLERDALLAARVLKVVQSPFYAGQMAIRSLRQAVVRMGLKSLRDLVVQSAVTAKVFQSRGYLEEMSLLMKHSTATAYLSRAVCKLAGIDGEYAFMAGLFHDLGIAATLLVLEEAPNQTPPPLAPLWPVVTSLHGDAAAIVIRKWNLPSTLEGVARFHHDLSTDPATLRLTAAVRLADCLTHEIGLSLRLGGHEVDDNEGATARDAMAVLGFGDAELEKLRAEARGILAHLKEIGAG